MIHPIVLMIFLSLGRKPGRQTKKAGVAEHPEVFHHAGILVNGPPGTAGLPFS
jgi:hypothetical protein